MDDVVRGGTPQIAVAALDGRAGRSGYDPDHRDGVGRTREKREQGLAAMILNRPGGGIG
jgi:hypothetical protein